MSVLSSLFQKKTPSTTQSNYLKTDIHSHLLPGIDDGSKSLEESLRLVLELKRLGYEKLITTPHIMSEYYKNTPEIILEKLNELRHYLDKNYVTIAIEAAAEYYVDEGFVKKLKTGKKLLTFEDNYLLFETGFMNKPYNLLEVIFEMQVQGYKPVFAHPERYTYLFEDFEFLENIYDKGVLLQVNIASLSGYYGKEQKLLAEKIINKNMVSFAGTDCHGTRHIEAIKKARKSKAYNKLLSLELKNYHI